MTEELPTPADHWRSLEHLHDLVNQYRQHYVVIQVANDRLFQLDMARYNDPLAFDADWQRIRRAYFVVIDRAVIGWRNDAIRQGDDPTLY